MMRGISLIVASLINGAIVIVWGLNLGIGGEGTLGFHHYGDWNLGPNQQHGVQSILLTQIIPSYSGYLGSGSTLKLSLQAIIASLTFELHAKLVSPFLLSLIFFLKKKTSYFVLNNQINKKKKRKNSWGSSLVLGSLPS